MGVLSSFRNIRSCKDFVLIENQLSDTVPSEQMTLVAGTLYFQSDSFVIAFHSVMVPLNVMLINLEQLWNALQPMLVTLPETITLVIAEQPANAKSQILVTLSGME